MKPKVIVSLTSWPPAIGFVPEAVRSLLNGTVLPDKIVLYLTASQFPDRRLPTEIEELKAREPLFEVRFWDENIRSYTKLVPALHDFPDDVIITVDDDMRYGPRTVERLVRAHSRRPDTIIAHNARRISLDGEGRLRPYRRWTRYKPHRYLWMWPRPGFRNLLFGFAGVLYPPRALDAAMLDPALFMSMAPTVDDVWFWAAATSAGTPVYPLPFGRLKPPPLGKSLDITLTRVNIRSGVDVNTDAVVGILKKFPVVRRRLEESIGKKIEL
jgi:hypothetical protein